VPQPRATSPPTHASARELISSATLTPGEVRRYLAERDAAAKATPTPAAVATFRTCFMCAASLATARGACEAALVVSHLTPTEFWAKVAAKFGF
jgi:hypothetical protein